MRAERSRFHDERRGDVQESERHRRRVDARVPQDLPDPQQGYARGLGEGRSAPGRVGQVADVVLPLRQVGAGPAGQLPKAGRRHGGAAAHHQPGILRRLGLQGLEWILLRQPRHRRQRALRRERPADARGVHSGRPAEPDGRDPRGPPRLLHALHLRRGRHLWHRRTSGEAWLLQHLVGQGVPEHQAASAAKLAGRCRRGAVTRL
mmetsp:Transcript_41639/g.120800  ORF Transcript_41639/g.120800 Transcript_41639/m.120800 type:complete len:205 (+) Transcript_41639:971-1585(+)